MTRILIITVNLFIAICLNFIASDPAAVISAPEQVNAGEAFVVNVTLSPNGETGFMRYAMEVPADWKAENVQNGGANFYFEKNSSNDNYSVKYLWSRVGDQPEIKLSFKLTPPASATGSFDLSSKISHTVNNLPVNLKQATTTVRISGSTTTTTTTTSPNTNTSGNSNPDSTAKPMANVSVIRTVPTEAVTGEFLVDIVINKEDLRNFGKYEDSLPAGFTAKKVMSDGATFNFEKGVAKFYWPGLPSKSTLHIQYKVIVAPELTGTQTIAGHFSYVENEGGRVARPNASVVTIAENPIATNTTTPPPLANVTVVRTVPTEPVSGEFIVDLVINKEDLRSFGKYEDSLPAGFSAQKVLSDGATFSFEKGVAKFYWPGLPTKSSLHIQYKVTISPEVTGTQTIAGHFSYVENDTGKVARANPSNVTVRENPVVQNNTNQNSDNTNTNNSDNTNKVSNNTNQNSDNTNTNNSDNTNKVSNNTNQNSDNTNTNNSDNTNKVSNNTNQNSDNTNTSNSDNTNKVSNNTNQNSDNTNTSNNNTQSNTNQQVNTQTQTNAQTNSGVRFGVQIAAMARMLPVSYFSNTFGISATINLEQIQGLNKYTTGSFANYEEARNHREQLRAKGVVGPFVTAYNGSRRITVQEALMLAGQKWIS
jgi:hypothetical protein